MVTRATPFCGRRGESMLRPLFLPPQSASDIAVHAFTVGAPTEVVYPADRTRRFSAAAVRWAIDSVGREVIGEWLDVDAILRRIDDAAWRPDSLVRAAFFDKLLPGLLWSIGSELPSRIDRRMSISDLPPVPPTAEQAAPPQAPPPLRFLPRWPPRPQHEPASCCALWVRGPRQSRASWAASSPRHPLSPWPRMPSAHLYWRALSRQPAPKCR